MRKFIYKSYIEKIIVCIFPICSATLSHAEPFPLVLSCFGGGTAGNTNMTLTFENLITGSGTIDGIPIVFSNMLSGGDASYILAGWPTAQNTGNARDIKNKIEISVNRYTGNYSMTISRVGGDSGVTGRSSGKCVRNQVIQRF